MTSQKRNIDEVQDDSATGPPAVRQKLSLDETNTSAVPPRINYPSNTTRGPTPAFQYPNQLITFSYSPSRNLEFTNSAMRYYVEPPFNADLGFAYETWIKRPEERGRLDGLLTACLRDEVLPERKRANVISWRGVMTKILTAPYEDRDAWSLNVMCLDGTLYFEEHLSDEKLKEKENMTPRNRLQSYYGYAFESYCSSATPDPTQDPDKRANGWSGNVNTNVQWCSVVKTKLGDNRLIIGGEVDCVQGKYTGQPNTFVELKTSLVIRNAQDEARFEKKLLKFYFQSFLLGVPVIRVGFRTPAGHLKNLQSFKTVELPRLVRNKPGAWDPNLCLQWGAQFLAFLQSTIRNWRFDETSSTNGNKDECLLSRPASRGNTPELKAVPREQCVWRVNFYPGKGAEIVLLDDAAVADVRNGEDRIGFLPRVYWDKVAGPVKTEGIDERATAQPDRSDSTRG